MFSLGPVRFTAFAYVQNVTNRKNIINVYYRTGSDNDGIMSHRWHRRSMENAARTYGENFLALYEEVNTNHRQHYWRTQGGDLYGHPREIRFGLEVAF